MKVYEFKCKECGETAETADPHTPPICHGEMRRVFTLGAISFKGSGFYRTDNS